MSGFLELSPARLYLVVAPRPIRRSMMTAFAVRLALTGPACLLDGGNSLDLYGLARQLRQQCAHQEEAAWQAALERVTVARAFTCYQMAALLSAAAGSASNAATLVLDLLDTFYDESVGLAERHRLLESCLPLLRRLARQACVVISAGTPSLISAPRPQSAMKMRREEGPGMDEGFLAMLEETADQVIRLEAEIPSQQQLRMF
jgi:hypothetical protein